MNTPGMKATLRLITCVVTCLTLLSLLSLLGLTIRDAPGYLPEEREEERTRETRYNLSERQLQMDLQLHRQQDATSRNVTKVLLVTYFRGGSTFLGEMFNSNHDVFYMFEPLVVPFDFWSHKTKRDYMNNLFYNLTGAAYTPPQAAIDDFTESILHILNCDLHKLDWKIFVHYFYTKWNKSQSFLSYKFCFHSLEIRKLDDRARVTMCLPLLVKLCRASSVRVIKTIRFSGLLADVLLRRESSIRVVYYSRDPRGMLVSQATLVENSNRVLDTSGMSIMALVICNRIHGDMLTFADLEKRGYGVMTLTYEELALRTLVAAHRMYKFLDLTLPGSVHEWIKSNTEAESANGIMGTRRNSSQVVTRWRNVLPAFIQQIINKKCRKAVNFFKYPLL